VDPSAQPDRSIQIFKFQPVVPFRLNDDWSVLTRTIFCFISLPTADPLIGLSPAGGFTQGLQPPGHIVAMAQWTENPAREVGRANTQEQNPTDPQARVPGSVSEVAATDEMRSKKRLHFAIGLLSVLGHDHLVMIWSGLYGLEFSMQKTISTRSAFC
jgi:hypothetical protein